MTVVVLLTFTSAVDTRHIAVSALALETTVDVNTLALATHVVFQTLIRVYTQTDIHEHTDTNVHTETETHRLTQGQTHVNVNIQSLATSGGCRILST